jgi:hypothetical protein
MSIGEAEAALPRLIGPENDVFDRAGLYALSKDIDVRAVGRLGVIIVQTIFELELPIALEGIDQITGDELDFSNRALVHQQIDEAARIAEMAVQIGNIRRQTGEQKPAVGTEPRNGNETVVGLVESGGILTRVLIGNENIAASGIIRPAVIAADMIFLPPLFERAQDGSAVSATVKETAQLTLIVSRDEHRLSTDMGRKETVLLPKLAFQTDEDPSGFEHRSQLTATMVLVGENGAVDRKSTLSRAILYQHLVSVLVLRAIHGG